MAKQRTYSTYAQEAVELLGAQIQLGRKERGWSEQNLAERAGVSRATLQKIERGVMGCAVGLVFELAALVGIPLFASDQHPLPRQRARVQDKLAVLPQRIKTKSRELNDDF